MRKVDELRNVIANQFACEYKAYDLGGICNAYGIEPDAGLEPMHSKRLYVLSGLNKLPDDDIWKLARRIVKEFENTEMIKTMEPYLADTELVFSFVTRRRIVDFLDSLSDMEGQMKLDDFLSFIWNMSEIPDIFIGTTVGEEIMSAVKYDKTMSYKELLTKQLQIDFDELLQYFGQVYKYFCDKEYFEVATRGVWRQIPYTQDSEQILPPSLLPSPEVYFATCLQDKEVWPIWQYLEEYDEQTLFSVIEILYDHIGVYNYEIDQFENEAQKEEFAEQINNILRAYKEGYYLEPTNGFIMQIPNGALREQLEYDGSDLPDSVYEQLATATEMYYRFDANLEQKKKAINILADILESEREEVKDTLNAEYEVPKNEHDKLIFGIVNGYNIRHNRADQKNDYSKEIWYDWMMQYYTSVIIAFYKLKNKYTDIDF